MNPEQYERFLEKRKNEGFPPVSPTGNGFILWGRIDGTNLFREDLGTWVSKEHLFEMLEKPERIERKPMGREEKDDFSEMKLLKCGEL